MVADDQSGIFIPARHIPAPTTVSESARAALATESPLTKIILSQEEPDPRDKAAWSRLLDELERLVAPMLAKAAERFPCSMEIHSLEFSNLFDLTPKDINPDAAGVALLYLHPGSQTSCKGLNAANMAMPFASKLGLRTFALDYRLPPDHPFPAAVNDSVDAYEFLLGRYPSERIVVAGRSAGGGLAAAMLLKARDAGMVMPAACILQTPEADLTESGDTFETNIGIDNFMRRQTRPIQLYSIETELHVWEAMGHGGFFGMAPEDEEIWKELRCFTRRHLRLQV